MWRSLRRVSVLIFKMRMAARKDDKSVDGFVAFAILKACK